jgi:hypothetical protein
MKCWGSKCHWPSITNTVPARPIANRVEVSCTPLLPIETGNTTFKSLVSRERRRTYQAKNFRAATFDKMRPTVLHVPRQYPPMSHRSQLLLHPQLHSNGRRHVSMESYIGSVSPASISILRHPSPLSPKSTLPCCSDGAHSSNASRFLVEGGPPGKIFRPLTRWYQMEDPPMSTWTSV